MSQRDCREQLIGLMRAQNDRVAAATTLLDEIKQAIADNRLEALQQALTDPDLALEEIHQLDQRRTALLQQYGFATDAAAQAQCIEWCDDPQGQLASQQRQLIENLQALQHSIQLNGLLVGKGRDRVRRSLGTLTGNGQAGQCKTYSSSGKTEQDSGQRNIAVA